VSYTRIITILNKRK